MSEVPLGAEPGGEQEIQAPGGQVSLRGVGPSCGRSHPQPHAVRRRPQGDRYLFPPLFISYLFRMNGGCLFFCDVPLSPFASAGSALSRIKRNALTPANLPPRQSTWREYRVSPSLSHLGRVP